ncbi:Uu.00g070130.m01.CDS01 [Anthostomella pinea]|uniref:Uu.00g070130.m01.CDS01 n=1 Tax=Anthostomella pinea TaxID=933095 RepID=A0AAI8YNL5_9PEZI|nr:Uu.00g070130.m01.CDS01 [Anthostomella pinea]
MICSITIILASLAAFAMGAAMPILPDSASITQPGSAIDSTHRLGHSQVVSLTAGVEKPEIANATTTVEQPEPFATTTVEQSEPTPSALTEIKNHMA